MLKNKVKVLLTINPDVLEKFDIEIGIIARSAAIEKLIKNYLEELEKGNDVLRNKVGKG